jgi:hypothetical protein
MFVLKTILLQHTQQSLSEPRLRCLRISWLPLIDCPPSPRRCVIYSISIVIH